MRKRYIVCYDISDPKRLRRMYRKMRGFGDPLQLSIFKCDLSDQERILLLSVTSELINQKKDRVMIIDTGFPDGDDSKRIEFIGIPLTLVEERIAVIV